jgi:hypothetical protein
VNTPINVIADRYFITAKCQRDVNARIGDFITGLHAEGWDTPKIGTVRWTGHNVIIDGWHFCGKDTL